MGGGWDGEKEGWILVKAPEGLCEIICLPFTHSLTVEGGGRWIAVFVALRLLLKNPSLRELLLLLQVARADSVTYLHSSLLHPRS